MSPTHGHMTIAPPTAAETYCRCGYETELSFCPRCGSADRFTFTATQVQERRLPTVDVPRGRPGVAGRRDRSDGVDAVMRVGLLRASRILAFQVLLLLAGIPGLSPAIAAMTVQEAILRAKPATVVIIFSDRRRHHHELRQRGR